MSGREADRVEPVQPRNAARLALPPPDGGRMLIGARGTEAGFMPE